MVLVWQRIIDMPWFHMIRWLHGDLKEASEEMTNASVVVNLKARGASISQGQVHRQVVSNS
jgi:hypothetical protein